MSKIIPDEKKIKHPKVFFRKLGRENAHGQSFDFGRKKYIEIDPRIKGKRLLDTFIHERVHFIFPDLHEESDDKTPTVGVYEIGLILSDFLWFHGYRMVEKD